MISSLVIFFEQFGKTQTVIATLFLLFVLERWFPAVQVRNNLNRLGKNFSLGILNLLIAPLIVLPLTHFAAGHALALRPLWWNIIFDLLILDLWIYAWHRLNHALPFLWRFHEVHHLDENLDTSTGLRFHFGEVALSSIVRAGFIWFLSIPFNTVVVFETLVVITALFQHSNLRIPPQIEAALSKLIITPSRHWVHHHALRQDTDSNYATILSVWDVLFKSRSPNERHMAMQMGVEGVKDENILRLIFRPFWRA